MAPTTAAKPTLAYVCVLLMLRCRECVLAAGERVGLWGWREDRQQTMHNTQRKTALQRPSIILLSQV